MGGFVPNYTQKQDSFQKHIDLMVKAMRSGQEQRIARKAGELIAAAVGFLGDGMSPTSDAALSEALNGQRLREIAIREALTVEDIARWFAQHLNRKLDRAKVIAGLTTPLAP